MTQLRKDSSSSGDIKSGVTKSNTIENENGIKGNKFGRGIKFREGVPIQLLKYNEAGNGNIGQIVLNPEALKIIQTINEPLAIISVGKQ